MGHPVCSEDDDLVSIQATNCNKMILFHVDDQSASKKRPADSSGHTGGETHKQRKQ